MGMFANFAQDGAAADRVKKIMSWRCLKFFRLRPIDVNDGDRHREFVASGEVLCCGSYIFLC